MQTYCREDAAAILEELGHIGLDKAVNEIAKANRLSGKFLFKVGHLLDIYQLSSLIPMDVLVYERYKARLNWDKVSELIVLKKEGIDFVLKNTDKINLATVITRMGEGSHPDESAFDYLIKKAFAVNQMTEEVWDAVSRNTKVSSTFLRTYQQYLNWYIVSQNTNIPKDMLISFVRQLDWKTIWTTRKVDEETIEMILRATDSDCIFNWSLVCSTQDLSEYFIEKYADKVNWCAVSEYQKLSFKFLRRNKDRICLDKIGKNRLSTKSDIALFLDTYDKTDEEILALGYTESDNPWIWGGFNTPTTDYDEYEYDGPVVTPFDDVNDSNINTDLDEDPSRPYDDTVDEDGNLLWGGF